ncbi:MAG: aminoglycoside phosphotransferase family protein [Lachnospiraceae bacterium]|nr:aminoglycoside phosphotransferase family protein [uncultured Acetatifactor sp.]MCI9218659.1 aminoglycoside phosphotransferase family protein [Lachnospiraceae bacterium]
MSVRINRNEILGHFDIGAVTESYGNGHINDTFLVTMPRYILQRINTSIFRNPEELMENIENVTGFLREKLGEAGEDFERGTLQVVPAKDGGSYYKVDDDNVFRVYRFVEGTKSIENSKTPKDLYEAGVGFGHFQKLLADFPVEKLHETIQDFHHTPKRIEALREAIRQDRAGRAGSVQREIDFALENASWADCVVKGMEAGRIPVRVTHNDTKINNILFDRDTGKAVCVIDLDTVMPGSMLYDFGDALRIGGSSAAEDETDLDKVWFEEGAFEAFAKGYLSEMRETLTEAEMALLPLSVKLMTYECGIRFLTDYLNGDTYFKIHREHHNLDRARNQFKLVADIGNKEARLAQLVGD